MPPLPCWRRTPGDPTPFLTVQVFPASIPYPSVLHKLLTDPFCPSTPAGYTMHCRNPQLAQTLRDRCHSQTCGVHLSCFCTELPASTGHGEHSVYSLAVYCAWNSSVTSMLLLHGCANVLPPCSWCTHQPLYACFLAAEPADTATGRWHSRGRSAFKPHVDSRQPRLCPWAVGPLLPPQHGCRYCWRCQQELHACSTAPAPPARPVSRRALRCAESIMPLLQR